MASKPAAIKWCAVGAAETAKCDMWSINSIEGDGTTIECESANSVEDCLSKIMVRPKMVRSRLSSSPASSSGSDLISFDHPEACGR